MRRTRFNVVGAIGVCLSAVFAPGGLARADDWPPPDCTVQKPLGVHYENPENPGVAVPQGPHTATVTVFEDGFFRTPPDDWRPYTATDVELHYYGIPPRPSPGPALNAWIDEWRDHYSGFGPARECVSDRYSSGGGPFVAGPASDEVHKQAPAVDHVSASSRRSRLELPAAGLFLTALFGAAAVSGVFRRRGPEAA